LPIGWASTKTLAAELDEQGLVRVGGGHSVTLAPDGWQLVKKSGGRPRSAGMCVRTVQVAGLLH